MTGILDGIRVVEMAAWVFVPSAGAILADHGADVIKVEHPNFPDPIRGLVASNLPTNAPNIMLETANRGKRGVGLDVSTESGYAALRKLIESADIFLTSLLTPVRQKLRVDVEHLTEWNPKLIYARGSGTGVRGPEASRPAFDASAYWYRSGIAYTLTPYGQEWPIGQRLGIGDLPSGAMLAGGVLGALYARERTGQPQIVDGSLMATATWTFAPDIVNGKLNPNDEPIKVGRGDLANPLGNLYKTQDGRIISLMLMESDRFWPDFCKVIGRTEWIDDPRFDHSSARTANSAELVRLLDEEFASRPLAEWRMILDRLRGSWGVVQKPADVAVDPQVVANGYLQRVNDREQDLWLASSPFQYGEQPAPFSVMPRHGEHTDEVLLSLGFTWDEIIEMKLGGGVL
jgi:crotonobetainyl-CoA:carnitine CoA-transferase CaiB-like acyl-CoA transferase